MLALKVLAVLLLQQNAALTPNFALPAVDTAALRHANGRVAPMMAAVRVTNGAPRIDGRLDDAIWALVEPVSGFRQMMPHDGDPATERTEVRLAYDDEAVYVAARMFDSEPARIAAKLGRRDNVDQSDMFEVDFDSYHDHRTSFQFYVNPLGVKMDVLAANDLGNGDVGWDPVWDVATQRDSLGWTAEFRIPLSQLRFPNAPTQVWGVNFFRLVERTNEMSMWSYFAQTDRGYASFFGHALGIANLPQPRRLEVLPYAAGVEERTAAGSPDNPFNDGSREVGRVGLDLNYGLTSNLTLNATVNPDFGQVEADPALINLTAYESYFDERRPFFVEGASIFRFGQGGSIRIGGSDFFYSRRIGRAPQGAADQRSGFVDAPTNSTIIGATKLSGRTSGGWTIGLLDAVTAREFATVDSAGVRFRDEVEPATNYALVRGQREFRRGGSTLGFIGTAVNRSIGDARLSFLRSEAYAGGVDFAHRFGSNRYTLWGSAGLSYIGGDTLAIQRAQLSSARYFQRPDADYVDYDPARTSLAGWTGTLGLSRDVGLMIYGVTTTAVSPGFEVNDVGYQTNADRAQAAFFAIRRWTRPGSLFRNAMLQVIGVGGVNFGGDRISSQLQFYAGGTFLNFWSAYVNLTYAARVVNPSLTRGGPAGISPGAGTASLSLSTDPRKPVRISGGGSYTRNDLDGHWTDVYSELTVRPSNTVSVSVSPSYSVSLTPQQYLAGRTDATAAATFGRRYLFAEISQRSLDLTTRLDVTLTTNLSLQLYTQPFVATGDYSRFKEFAAPRTSDYIVYGETPGSSLTPVTNPDGSVAAYDLDPDGAGPRPVVRVGNPDFSSRSLRGNAVLRWEYRPGSTLFLVWTNSCSAYGSQPVFDAANDLRHLCQGRADNVFAVKFNYWLSL